MDAEDSGRIRVMIAAKDTEGARAKLLAALSDGESIEAKDEPRESLPDDIRKTIDPIALAALIVSIPGAILTVMDIADRIRKRRRAAAVITAAQELRASQQAEIYLVGADKAPVPISSMDEDALLEAVKKLDKGS